MTSAGTHPSEVSTEDAGTRPSVARGLTPREVGDGKARGCASRTWIAGPGSALLDGSELELRHELALCDLTQRDVHPFLAGTVRLDVRSEPGVELPDTL